MKDKIKTGYSDRLAAAADARKAQLAKFKPKPAVTATATTAEFKTREQIKAEEREAFRLARIKAKEDAALAVAEREAAALEAKRSERKERKAAVKADQRARKSSRYTTLDALADLHLGNREAS